MVNHARVPCYQKTSLEEESKMSHLSVLQTLCRKKPKRLDHENINPTPLGDRTTRFLSWKLYRQENIINTIYQQEQGVLEFHQKEI